MTKCNILESKDVRVNAHTHLDHQINMEVKTIGFDIFQ